MRHKHRRSVTRGLGSEALQILKAELVGSIAPATVCDLAAKPLEVHASAVDIGVAVPQPRRRRASAGEDLLLYVGDVARRRCREDRGRSGDVNTDPLHRRAACQEARRRIPASGNNRGSRLQPRAGGGLCGHCAHDGVRLDDPRQQTWVKPELLTQPKVPPAGGVVRES